MSMQTKMREEFNQLTERLSAFGEKAKRVLHIGNKDHAGEYSNLNESLLDEEENGHHGPQGDYFTSSGSAHAYQVNNHSGNHERNRRNSERNRREQNDFSSGNVHLPSEAEMMIETTSLAKEAAELLWETIAFQAGCADSEKDPQMVEQMADLADKATSLTSQLRGLIRNHLQGGGGEEEGQQGSESLLASALEVKDMLDSCLSEYKETQKTQQQQQQQLSSPHSNGGLKKDQTSDVGLDAVPEAEDPAPLIQLDDFDNGDVLPPPAVPTSVKPPTSSQSQSQLPQSTPARGSIVDPFSNAFDTLQFGASNANVQPNNN